MQARCQLGNKYGILMEGCPALLATAPIPLQALRPMEKCCHVQALQLSGCGVEAYA